MKRARKKERKVGQQQDVRQEAEGHILDTYSAKARGTRRTRWAGQARLSIQSIVARRTRRTLHRGHKP